MVHWCDITIELFYFDYKSNITFLEWKGEFIECLQILKDCFISILFSSFHSFLEYWNPAIMLSIILSWLEYFFQSCFQSWNPMQKKGEKTSPENLVPICPALSWFVHQPPILQHYKSQLLCNGVTNRRGQGCKTRLVNGWAYRSTLTPIRPWRISIFVRK